MVRLTVIAPVRSVNASLTSLLDSMCPYEKKGPDSSRPVSPFNVVGVRSSDPYLLVQKGKPGDLTQACPRFQLQSQGSQYAINDDPTGRPFWEGAGPEEIAA